MFPAKLIQSAKASVLPVYFEGQNGRLFHLASRFSLTLRLSLLIREFCRLSGKTISSSIGTVVAWEDIASLTDRKVMLQYLYDTVFSMSGAAPRIGAA
jgi:putative hemolysin